MNGIPFKLVSRVIHLTNAAAIIITRIRGLEWEEFIFFGDVLLAVMALGKLLIAGKLRAVEPAAVRAINTFRAFYESRLIRKSMLLKSLKDCKARIHLLADVRTDKATVEGIFAQLGIQRAPQI
jgi:hypothetical protein